MKRFLLSVVLATSLAFTSCQFDDSDIWDKFGEVEESIRDHEERISALEELCKQMNTNIEALQTLVEALEKRDYVTNVSEVRSNGVVIGYTISFAYSGDITIYHGQNGKDGYTPQIGVMQDADNIFYWTLDGEWLLDDNGNKIKANATDGKDGQNGSNGTDGITPLLKIENDYWLVSYDNGTTWVQLGKATGEDGANGENGDSIFKSVTEDEDNVYFTLADGTVITLPKGDKKTNVDDVCSLMEDITFMKYCYDNFDANKDGMLSQTEAASVYTIDISGLDIYSLAGIKMFTRLESIIAKKCTKLREVVIPNTITSIGDEAFYGCSSLASVTIPESVTSIGGSAFSGCTGELIINSKTFIENDYTSTNYPMNSSNNWLYGSKFTKLTIGENTTKIGVYTFYKHSTLTSITIPDSVTSIGARAFSGCTSLTSVTIGNSVTSIGDYTFYNCESLTSVTVPDSVTSIGNYAFESCSSLTSVTIPNSVTSIGNYAFRYCTSLTSVTIPNSVTSIESSAFYGCTSLTSVTIPNTITSIGDEAFYGCSSLASVTIPNSVTSIGYRAFYNCTSLTSVYCKPTTLPSGGSYMFDSNASGRRIYVPTASVEAYKSAYYWSRYASYIEGYNF